MAEATAEGYDDERDDPFVGAPFLVRVSRGEIVDRRFRVKQADDGTWWREPTLREVVLARRQEAEDKGA